MITPEVADIAARISRLTWPERLRLAADLLEARQAEMARVIADGVAREIGAALAVRKMEGKK